MNNTAANDTIGSVKKRSHTGKNISRRSFMKNSALVLGAITTANFKVISNVFAASKEKEMSDSAVIEKDELKSSGTRTAMKISVKANGKTTVFELNDSPAARDLYAQLPMSITVENFSDNEKIFYPPKKLSTGNTPQADAQAGTLAYYAPWGDVVMFYRKFGSASGLYELGHAISGSEYISGMSGEIMIEKVSAP